MRVIVTGGAGFVGSHLVDALAAASHDVVVIDDLSTGAGSNLEAAIATGRVQFLFGDVSQNIDVDGQFDIVYHLASPASPPAYLARPFATLAVGSEGTRRALDVALDSGATFVMASTSEVYGDPLVHPQTEDYWGNVNPTGPRSVYDEAKRFSEAISYAYHRYHELPVSVVRIFNTYGPRLAAGDGRVVSNFIVQALRGEPLTVYGDGSQTRSLCFVADLVRGLLLAGQTPTDHPVNLGNPQEITVLELAHLIRELTGSASSVEHFGLPADDPTRRRPDITRAREVFGWEPHIDMRDGLVRTINAFRDELAAH